jgi:hypothetical protein
MVAITSADAPLQAPLGPMDGTQAGKRYVDAQSEIELLCVKPGDGSLSLDDRPALLKEAKRLPSSD